MLRYKGTLWEHVLIDPWFWFHMATCILFILLRTLDVLPKGENPEIPTSSLAIIGSLVSFAAVFFLNMVFGRFHDQLLMMIALGGNIYNCTSLAVATFEGEHAHERANQLARYGNALNHVCFYTIGQIDNFRYLVQNRMLSHEEAETLSEFKGKKTNLLATWMLDTLETASREGTAPRIDRATRMIIFEIRKNAALLQDLQTKYPPPLGYFHFLVVALHSWLFLLAYSTPYLPDNNNQVWLTFVLYFVIAFAYMGISAVATAHVDPWGEDSSDVDVLTEIDGVLRQTRQLLRDRFHPALGATASGLDFEGGYKGKDKPHPKSKSRSLYNLPGVITFLQPKSRAVAKYISRANESELGCLVKARHRYIEDEDEDETITDTDTTSIGIDSPDKRSETQSNDSCSYDVTDNSDEINARRDTGKADSPGAETSGSGKKLTAKKAWFRNDNKSAGDS